MQHTQKRKVFITFEGIEGSGKTTQITALREWLKKKGYPVLLTHEPGGTPIADEIRQFLLHSQNKTIPPSTELFLYETARKDHVSQVIRPALEEGKIVLCDRFTDATVAYQGFGRGLSLKVILTMNQIATGGLKPHRTFLLDLPVPMGLQRVRKRKKELDRLESENQKFHQKVRDGYLTLARKEKKRFRIIDAERPQHEIFARICHEVERLL